MTIGMAATRGKPQKPIHSKEEDYSCRLLGLRRTRFVLCGVDDRESWLVNGLSTLLHLVRSYLAYAEHDKLHQGILLMKANDFKAKGGRSGLKAAFETLRCNENRALKVHHKGGPSLAGKTEKSIEDYCCLEDLIRFMLDIVEQIVDHQGDVRFEQKSVGYRVKASPLERLEGFDFMDLAMRERVISSRAMRLRPDGKGWVELTRALDAPTLFGRHFGEMVEPVDTDQSSRGCSTCHWNDTMPPGRDLLAVQIEDLLDLRRMTRESSRLWFPHGLCLEIPPLLFEPCSQYKPASRCQDHERIRSLRRAPRNSQPAHPTRADASTGFLAKVLLSLNLAGLQVVDGNDEGQSSSPIKLPPDGAILLGLPRKSNELHSQTISQHMKRLVGYSTQTPSSTSIDDPQVAVSSSQSNDTTTNNLDSENSHAQSGSTPRTHLTSPGLLSNSAGDLYSPESSVSASLQPSHDDLHRRKRARRRAEARAHHRQN